MEGRGEVKPAVKAEEGVIDGTKSPVKEATELASMVGRKLVIVTEDPSVAYSCAEESTDDTGRVKIALIAFL